MGKSWILIVVLALSFFAFSEAQSQERNWTNRNGVIIWASLISDRNDIIVLRKGTRNYTVPFNSLSNLDQDYIVSLRQELSRRHQEEQQRRILEMRIGMLAFTNRAHEQPVNAGAGMPSANIFGVGNTAWTAVNGGGYAVTNLATGQTLAVSDEGNGEYAAMDLTTGQRFAIADNGDGLFAIMEIK